MQCPQRPGGCRWIPWSWSERQLWATQHRCWKLNSGSQQEPYILLTTKTPLQCLYSNTLNSLPNDYVSFVLILKVFYYNLSTPLLETHYHTFSVQNMQITMWGVAIKDPDTRLLEMQNVSVLFRTDEIFHGHTQLSLSLSHFFPKTVVETKRSFATASWF